ncbi:MAG TPA: hypothetical protein VID24_04335 [Candidatus Eremiobacteraceae bacterium]
MQLLVVSGLAAGADLIAAEEAVDLGLAVLGCLPMPQAEYERDFAAEELERFRRVLPRCTDIIVVGTAERREQGYIDVGNFIAYYAQVLVAFWDGLPARGPGGTAHVVELRRRGLPSVVGDELVAYMPDVGPVIQIVTPRAHQPAPADCFAEKTIHPEGSGDFERAITHIERFDRDLSESPPSSKRNRLAALADRADAAANRLQAHTLRSLRSVYVAAALAGAAQLVLPADGSFGIPSWAGIAARIGFLAIAFAVFAFAKRGDFENRYQDYRAIAEALRVQYAWWCAGLRTRLVEASYLQMQQSELAWIRSALRTAYLVTGSATAKPDSSSSDPECSRWIEGQIDYYERAGELEAAHMAQAQRAMRVTAIGGAVISAAAGLAAWAISHHWINSPVASGASMVRVLTYWAAMPVAVGSLLALLIRFYVQQRAFAENARRYQLMFTVFDAARRRLREGIDDPRRILEQLGHEALSEHAEWLILHRDRPLTFVHT